MFPTILCDGYVLLFSVRRNGFSCIGSSAHRMLRIHSNSFQMQIPHLGPTADLLFLYLLKAKESSAAVHETAYKLIVSFVLIS